MSRKTRREKEKTTEIFYGIDPSTFAVELVFLHGNGELTKFGPSGASARHLVIHNRNPMDEIVIVWGLTDVISVPAGMTGTDFAKQQLAALKEKAMIKKTAATKLSPDYKS